MSRVQIGVSEGEEKQRTSWLEAAEALGLELEDILD